MKIFMRLPNNAYEFMKGLVDVHAYFCTGLDVANSELLR